MLIGGGRFWGRMKRETERGRYFEWLCETYTQIKSGFSPALSSQISKPPPLPKIRMWGKKII